MAARWRFTIMTPSITDRSEMPLLHSVQSSLKVIGRHLDKKRKHSSSFVKKIHGNSHICDNHEAWFPWLNTPFHAFLNNGFLKWDDDYFDMPNYVLHFQKQNFCYFNYDIYRKMPKEGAHFCRWLFPPLGKTLPIYDLWTVDWLIGLFNIFFFSQNSEVCESSTLCKDSVTVQKLYYLPSGNYS